MESNQNENVMSIENELELNVNEYWKDNCGIFFKKWSLQTKHSRVKDNEEKMQIKFQKLCFQRKYGEDITKKLHYVGPSIAR